MTFATLGRGAVRTVLTVFCASFITVSTAHAAPILVENFDDITTLSGSGWSLLNLSSPAGITSWFQGNAGVFGAQSGAPNSYVAANFLGADFGGNVDMYLVTPDLTLDNGDILSFFTRTSSSVFNDGLQVLLSTNGGIFTPLLTLATVPDSDWTEYSLALSGLSGPTATRFAFRYFVTDTSVNGDYIGIDTVSVSPNPVPEPSTLSLLGLGALAGARSWRRRFQRGDR